VNRQGISHCLESGHPVQRYGEFEYGTCINYANWGPAKQRSYFSRLAHLKTMMLLILVVAVDLQLFFWFHVSRTFAQFEVVKHASRCSMTKFPKWTITGLRGACHGPMSPPLKTPL